MNYDDCCASDVRNNDIVNQKTQYQKIWFARVLQTCQSTIRVACGD